MLIAIGAYKLCNGTRAGGVGVTGLRFRVDRAIDIVAPIGAADPQTLDRNGRKVQMSFSITRTHESADAAEQFVIAHESEVPATGIVKLTAGPIVRHIPNGKVTSHELSSQNGSTTIHAYTIVGGKPANLPTS